MVENRGGHFLGCGISRAFRGMRCSNGRCYYAFWIAVVSWGRGGGVPHRVRYGKGGGGQNEMKGGGRIISRNGK